MRVRITSVHQHTRTLDGQVGYGLGWTEGELLPKLRHCARVDTHMKYNIFGSDASWISSRISEVLRGRQTGS